LGGASQIVTVDPNPYLKWELVLEDLAWIRNFPWEVKALFGGHARNPLFQQRFSRLLQTQARLEDLCRMMSVRYLSPADAAALPLPPETIDYHVSCRVLEHLPGETLSAVLQEGKRLLKTTGLFVHLVDFADHFAPTDPSISTINFLRFSEAEWQHYAGNKFMYQNRLRVSDLAGLFRQAGLATSLFEPEIDPRALEELKNDFPLNERFAALSPEQIATATAWIVASVGGSAEGSLAA
jgi:SAM-dependent methyltransferase